MTPKLPPLDTPSADDWRELRARHRLTQRELADLVHRTPETIKKWEAGHGSDRACWRLALMVLDKEPSWVLVDWSTGSAIEVSRHHSWEQADAAREGMADASIEDSRTWNRIKATIAGAPSDSKPGL
ncbi:helix-turn-helix domain-containing protein [Ancylobacter oerskovii]|uniref:Helix-turn-helix domain-containing protein n=1 Tax=Ancylobacter oerskovii TaxID=459519 RepID=A0ABW4Z5I8_9HYPH|nr:helix-turn-helix domain-containing protein [Ancylobacter oerskovii]MBS7545558.1 helix-turn-helix domain-containing protein [Ancylobacter oerskovii]